MIIIDILKFHWNENIYQLNKCVCILKHTSKCHCDKTCVLKPNYIPHTGCIALAMLLAHP